MLKKWFS